MKERIYNIIMYLINSQAEAHLDGDHTYCKDVNDAIDLIVSRYKLALIN